MADTRKEAGSLGEVDVPADKFWGAQIRYGVCAVFLAAPTQSEPIPSAQNDARSGPDALPPGEYPNHLFKPPFPPPTAEESKELDDKYLFGDWLGYHSQLAAQGIKPALLLLADPFGNVTGGRRRGITEYGLFGVDVILETGKLLGWPGGQFRAGFAYSSGTSLSKRYVGNNFPIQLADVATPGPRLTYLSYTQSMLDDKLSIRFGRLTINSVYGEEFLASEYFKAFSSVGFDLVPLGIFLNAPGAFGYPITTWGARIKFEPAEQFYVMAGAYNGDPVLKASSRGSVDFSLRGPSFAIGEVGFRRNYGEAAKGLPGNLKLGGTSTAASSRPGIASGATSPGVPAKIVRGNYGFYILGDQAILRWGDPGENRHLSVFAALTVAPDERVNPVPHFFDAGVVAYGFLPSRPQDFAGFGVVYGSYSGDQRRAEEVRAATSPSVAVQDHEMTLEWTYGYAVQPGLLLQPDVQFIINPGGNKAIQNALAIGVKVVVNF